MNQITTRSDLKILTYIITTITAQPFTFTAIPLFVSTVITAVAPYIQI